MLVVSQRVVLAGLDLCEKSGVILRPNAYFQFAPATVLDTALVTGLRWFSSQVLHVPRKFVRKFRSLHGSPGKPGAQVITVDAFGRLPETLFAVPASGNQIIECVDNISHRLPYCTRRSSV